VLTVAFRGEKNYVGSSPAIGIFLYVAQAVGYETTISAGEVP